MFFYKVKSLNIHCGKIKLLKGDKMNPFAMGNVPDVPTREELWKDEKSKYRIWIVLFSISLLAIFALFLTSVILNALNEDDIVEEIQKFYLKNNQSYYEQYAIPANKALSDSEGFWKNSMIYGGIKLGLVAVSVVLFFTTLVDSYRHHSFEKISKFASYIVGLSAFIGMWQLTSMLFHTKTDPTLHFDEGVFQFAGYLVPILIWLFVSIPVNKMRREFQVSAAVEKIKADPRYQEMVNAQMNGESPFGSMSMGPMGPVSPFAQPQTQAPNNQAPKSPFTPQNQQGLDPSAYAQARELTPEEKREIELKTMTILELKKVAKQLSISGYQEMSKTELVEAIMRVS